MARLEVNGLAFSYGTGQFSLRVDSFSCDAGEAVAWVGPSGSGKTTCLQLVVGILPISRGSVLVDGAALETLSEARRRAFRCSRVGMVFQDFELLDYLSALDNILLPFRVNPGQQLDAEARERAHGLAARLGIGDKLKRRPSRLSQGEAQRVAICRALVTRPRLVLADEPTGNLDPANKEKVVALLADAAREADAAFLMVTHDHSLLGSFDRVENFAELANPSHAVVAE